MDAKKQIITIAGRPASGKSTTAKAVAAKLGFQHFSSGDLFRAIGAERGVDLLQANLLAERNSEIDHLVDQRLCDLGNTENQLVIDSRLAWHWIPASFKVFLDLDLTIAAERILSTVDKVRALHENIPQNVKAYAADLQKRLDSETRRYDALYNINPYDTANYDLVVDTAKNDIDATINLVIASYKQWLG